MAQEADVACLLLNHFVPVRFDRNATLDAVRQAYKGPAIVGEDLMRYDIATRRLTHRGGLIGF